MKRLGPILLLSLSALAGPAQEGPRPPREAAVFLTEIPAHPGSVILARPTATSVTLSLLLHGGGEVELVWGKDPASLPARGRALSLPMGGPVEVVLEGLAPSTRYHYALLEVTSRRRVLPVAGPGTFHTARRPGEAFAFTVTSDSHLDGGCSPDRYDRVLARARADGPDFHLDLGDTFMSEKHPSRDSALAQYAAQRYRLGRLAEAAPLFLSLGNHDGEGPDRQGRTPEDGLGLWAHHQRTRWFPNPRPDGFYRGNGTPLPNGAAAENYYAWTWGDALFVVLDPYWTSRPTRGGREPWNTTLGEAQVRWLADTLRGSKARYKFVFIHQLTGSDHPAGRGGAEASAFLEWGGRDLDGTEAFRARRAGWEKPIHDLLVETGVSAVFHGHDHFYAHQVRDGVVYQLVPQPAHRNTRSHEAQAYGYRSGAFLPASGYLRVRVSAEAATVDYLREGEGNSLSGIPAASTRILPKGR